MENPPGERTGSEDPPPERTGPWVAPGSAPAPRGLPAAPPPFPVPPPPPPPQRPATGPWPPPSSPWPPPYHQGWAPQPGWPPPRPRRSGARNVLFSTAVALTVAGAALAASVVVLVSTPREDPPTGGADLALYYDRNLTGVPEPATVDLVDHPLYSAPMPTGAACELPDLDVDSDASWLEFAEVTGECLDTLWAPVLNGLGLFPEAPEVGVSGSAPGSVPIDPDAYVLGYYEPDPLRITLVLPSVRAVDAGVPPQDRELIWFALMAHEYGHHVQNAAGMFELTHASGGADSDQEMLRRSELQAECLAGAGMRAITGDEDALRAVNTYLNGGGDLDSHGSAANRSHWFERGWSQETVDGCNTYDAESSRVS
ncbi:neutral zinc metallopeptidase [Nocardiopsis sp. CNT312]|uniref:neutral zinc metallopeptidase n=1 Tax=Nocardiopsis sp. CNT312 TaxID=1137268 RepID=UPI0004BCB25D|nr:neutral zinc metallopeptidase [Nocardiopsis sp. CNT312]